MVELQSSKLTTRVRFPSSAPRPLHDPSTTPRRTSEDAATSSPAADALAGLRANEARYFPTKWGHALTTEPAEGERGAAAVAHVTGVLATERDITVASRPLEASTCEDDGVHWSHVSQGSGLAVNVLRTLADGGKRAVGSKPSDGMEVPAELAERFRFARQRSNPAGTIRGSFFVIKGEHALPA